MPEGTTYKGCRIFWVTPTRPGLGYVWEDMTYGTESEDAFATVEEARRDIDQWFSSDAAPPVVVNNEIQRGDH
jgi:hypothetical protein